MEKQKPVIELDLYLIRHGESKGNAGYGRDDLTIKEANDPYLTEKGLSQAHALGKYLKDTAFDAFYSSALLRAVQTATEIIKEQPEEKELNVLPLLTEVSIKPEYQGADIEELREIWHKTVIADGVDASAPLVCYNAYEDEKGMFERASKAVEYLLSHYKNGEKVAVVSHAAFMTFFVFRVMGFKDAVPVFDISFKNTSVTRIIFYKHGTNPYGDIVFEYINSTSHLA